MSCRRVRVLKVCGDDHGVTRLQSNHVQDTRVKVTCRCGRTGVVNGKVMLEAGGRPRASAQVYFRDCRLLTGAVAMISCGGEQRSSSNIDDRPDGLRGAFQTKEYR